MSIRMAWMSGLPNGIRVSIALLAVIVILTIGLIAFCFSQVDETGRLYSPQGLVSATWSAVA